MEQMTMIFIIVATIIGTLALIALILGAVAVSRQ
jgi:hypothetical protein